MTTHPLAHNALAWINQLYDIEDRLAETTSVNRHKIRERESVPILTHLHEQLRIVQPTVRPTSKLYEAIGYLLNRWEAMTRFTRDGRYAAKAGLVDRIRGTHVIRHSVASCWIQSGATLKQIADLVSAWISVETCYSNSHATLTA